MTEDGERISADFDQAVNMTAAELEQWLGTEESKSVGDKSGGEESTGHRSGRRIVEIPRKRKGDLGEDDYAHMRKVTGYVRRHLRQRPSGDVEETRWRHSLTNWGNDPIR